jgi:hypothetical protein
MIAKTADIQKDHPILVVVRDNAGKNTSKELYDYFTEHGVENYFSTPYEQWQIGLAEGRGLRQFSDHAWKDGDG